MIFLFVFTLITAIGLAFKCKQQKNELSLHLDTMASWAIQITHLEQKLKSSASENKMLRAVESSAIRERKDRLSNIETLEKDNSDLVKQIESLKAELESAIIRYQTLEKRLIEMVSEHEMLKGQIKEYKTIGEAFVETHRALVKSEEDNEKLRNQYLKIVKSQQQEPNFDSFWI